MARAKNSKSKPTEKQANSIHKMSKDKVAQAITNFFGSMAFLIAFVLMVLLWIAWNNNIIPGLTPFDPAPFAKLEFFLSAFAICLTIAVLISQKRQARLEKIAEQVEFEVNLRAEKEITKVLEMLQRIEEKLGVNDKDPKLKKMIKDLDTEKLRKKQLDDESDD